jgi:hypothetical protein
MCITALFTIDKFLNHPKDTSSGWIDKKCGICTLWSVIQPYRTKEVVQWKIDGTRDHHVTGNKPDSERQVSCVFSHMRNLGGERR